DSNTALRGHRSVSGGLEKPKIPSRELPRISSGELKRLPSRDLDVKGAPDAQRSRPSMLSGRCSFGSPPVPDDRREERLASYHISSLAGLTSHARWTPEEAEELGAQLAKRRYTVQLCDCDRVRYVPSETHPGYIQRAEETVKK